MAVIQSPIAGEALYYSIYKTGIGFGYVVASGLGLLEAALPASIGIDDLESALQGLLFGGHGNNMVTKRAAELLTRYFAGEKVDFALPFDKSNWTAFQTGVYQVVGKIPYGSVKTYGEVARLLGKPRAARGVGSAMARNHLPIIIPCHRVIGSSGDLTGYSAPGGKVMKQRLLDMEAAISKAKSMPKKV
jgi:methylated-DNA-[protein]-cysteine S-methyltransferase